MEKVQDVLEACTQEGKLLRLPDVQLDPKLYRKFAKVLEGLGGKWKGGSVRAFVFEQDPSDELKSLREDGIRNMASEYQYFPTPMNIAAELVQLADIEAHHSVLEPSAGTGHICKAVWNVHPKIKIDVFELWGRNIKVIRELIEKRAPMEFRGADFLKKEDNRLYDRIIANPPFAKNQDILHVRKMYACLADEGRLVAIMSPHWKFASDKPSRDFRKWMTDVDGNFRDLPEGAFATSGTNVRSCVVVIDN
ncbi:methyltransferase [Larkinella harenae]